MRRLWSLALLLIFVAAPASASLERALAALVDRAADRPVSLEGFRAERPSLEALACWNGCPSPGSQNIPVIAAAAAGDFGWVAALSRLERREGLYGSELGSPGFYYVAVQQARMVALRDARRALRLDLAGDITLALRAAWAWDALVSVPLPRTSAWADLAGDGIVTGPGNAASYRGISVAVAGNRWNGRDVGDRWLDRDDHGVLLSWALDWTPRRAAVGVLRSTSPGRGNVVAYLAGVRDYSAPAPAAAFGLTEEERRILREVVWGDVEAARTAAGWLADFGCRRDWRFELERTRDGAQVVFLGPNPNPNKPPHAATSISSTGEWRTIRPSRWGRRNGETVAGYEVRREGGEIIARVLEGEEVRMTELGGAPLWRVEVAGAEVRFVLGDDPEPGRGLILRPRERDAEERRP